MWGLVAFESILSGAFLFEYTGEVTLDKDEKRNVFYDKNGYNYIFALENDDENDEQFLIDACFYGNESRFVNHSCSPNLIAIPLHTNNNSRYFHKFGLFANRQI